MRAHVELAAEQTRTLAHADETESAAARRVDDRARDVEAVAVVLHARLDPVGPSVHVDRCRRRVAVLADVVERLLEDPEERDLLRARHRLEVAAQLQLDGDSRLATEAVHLALEHPLQRAGGDARRLERVRELTQASIECGEPRFEVVEASGGDSADFPLDVWNDSTPRVANVVRERGEILERAVVQVEAEPQEPLLRRVDEQALARVRSLEQPVALDDGGDG